MGLKTHYNIVSQNFIINFKDQFIYRTFKELSRIAISYYNNLILLNGKNCISPNLIF